MGKEPTEQDYINFLEENWGTDTLPGTSGVDLVCYLDRTEQVDGNTYANDFHEDHFYPQFEETFKPTLNVDIDEYGGLICRNDGIAVDYGCGLNISTLPDLNNFKNFLSKFFNVIK